MNNATDVRAASTFLHPYYTCAELQYVERLGKGFFEMKGFVCDSVRSANC